MKASSIPSPILRRFINEPLPVILALVPTSDLLTYRKHPAVVSYHFAITFELERRGLICNHSPFHEKEVCFERTPEQTAQNCAVARAEGHAFGCVKVTHWQGANLLAVQTVQIG